MVDRQQMIKYGGLAVLLVLLSIGLYVSYTEQQRQAQQAYNFPSPEAVVRQYFEAWDGENYPDMYATLSDGFKKIDPNAQDLATFRQFASTQGIRSVKILLIKERSNDGTTAAVDYEVEFVLNDGSRQPFTGTFTLKYRTGDVIQGWKLIHPYGNNIDTS